VLAAISGQYPGRYFRSLATAGFLLTWVSANEDGYPRTDR